MSENLVLKIKELVGTMIEISNAAIEKAENEGNSITYNFWVGALESYRNIERIIDNDY